MAYSKLQKNAEPLRILIISLDLHLKLQDIYAKLNPSKRNHQKLTENPLYQLEKVEDIIRYNLSIILLITGIPQICSSKSQTTDTVDQTNLKKEDKSVQG